MIEFILNNWITLSLTLFCGVTFGFFTAALLGAGKISDIENEKRECDEIIYFQARENDDLREEIRKGKEKIMNLELEISNRTWTAYNEGVQEGTCKRFHKFMKFEPRGV